MANCPKCGARLKLTDWRPTCPHCGINLIYYGMEERLLEDADKAESEHAVFQKKLDRLKASFIGSPLTIIRIVLSLLPIGALMLPLANVSFWGPFFEKKVSVNAITIYNAVSALDFDALFKYIGSSFFGNTFLLYFISLVTILLSAVLILVSLIMLTMGCSKHGNPRNITLNSIMIVLATVSIVCFNFFAKDLTKFFPDVFSGSVGFGVYVFLGTLVALLVINIVIAKVGVKVKYTETFIGGIPSEEYFEYVKQGMSTHAIRKMMAEIDANNKVELAMKAKEEADKLEAEAEKLSAEAKAAEAAALPMRVTRLSSPLRQSMRLRRRPWRPRSSQEKLPPPWSPSSSSTSPAQRQKKRKLSPQTKSKNNIGFSKPYSIRCAALFL